MWINVQYVHAYLSARRAWPSFSCRCVSTGEACQTPGSPFQRCQRTFQALSDARIKKQRWRKTKECEGVSTEAAKRLTAKMTNNEYCTFLAKVCVTFGCTKKRCVVSNTDRWESDTSSLVLSTSLGSLALPLLVIMSIS